MPLENKPPTPSPFPQPPISLRRWSIRITRHNPDLPQHLKLLDKVPLIDKLELNILEDEGPDLVTETVGVDFTLNSEANDFVLAISQHEEDACVGRTLIERVVLTFSCRLCAMVLSNWSMMEFASRAGIFPSAMSLSIESARERPILRTCNVSPWCDDPGDRGGNLVCL